MIRQTSAAPAKALTAVAIAPEVCAHCGLPLAGNAVAGDRALRFCCRGCRTVFGLLRSSGLDRYYALRDDANVAARPVTATTRSYGEWDDPAFLAAYSDSAGDGRRSAELYLGDMHCAACIWLVEKLPRLVPGVIEARADFGAKTARVVWDERTTASGVAHALDRLGYPPHPARTAEASALRQREHRSLLLRLGVAGASAGNVMLLSFGLYSGEYGAGMDAATASLFRWTALVVSLPAVVWSANLFYRHAVAALRARTPHIDLPVSVGILAAFLGGVVNTVRGAGPVYFDSVTALIFLLLCGRFVERRAGHAARAAAELRHALVPSTARLVDGDEPRLVPASSVASGSLVEVLADEHVPVDGVVVHGGSSLDTSLLTGESEAERVEAGSRVFAGTVNIEAPLVVRALTSGGETRVAALLARLASASASRPRVVKMADKVAGYFVVATLVLAGACAAIWLLLDAEHALDHTVALLVVACPCALALATPLAVSAAIAKAAKWGLLIKDSRALERLAAPALFVFDKTGTLTEGKLALCYFEGDAKMASYIAAAEAQSAHPIARAFVHAFPHNPAIGVEHLVQVPGNGLQALVDGRSLVVGSPRFVRERARVGAALERAITQHARAGRTPVLAALDGAACALGLFEDPVRPDARDSLLELSRHGARLAVLSGDCPDVVRAVAAELGIEFEFVEGGAAPEHKLERVRELERTRPVVMVGDGVNDAAALALANVGIAVHGGAEASLLAADVFATSPGLAPVAKLVRGAHRTLRTIRRGIALSAVYNAAGVGLSLLGLVTPLMAAILMPLSSLSVTVYAYRARTFGGRS